MVSVVLDGAVRDLCAMQSNSQIDQCEDFSFGQAKLAQSSNEVFHPCLGGGVSLDMRSGCVDVVLKLCGQEQSEKVIRWSDRNMGTDILSHTMIVLQIDRLVGSDSSIRFARRVR